MVAAEAQTWLNRLAMTLLLLQDPGAASNAYVRSCDYPLESDPPSLGVECLAGLAVTEFFETGPTDRASERATRAAKLAAEKQARGTAFIMAHMAVAINLINTGDAAKAEAELGRVDGELSSINFNANPTLTALVAAMFNKVGEIYWDNEKPEDVTRVTMRAVELHASTVNHTDPELFQTLHDAATYGKNPEVVRGLVLWMCDIAEADPNPDSAQLSMNLAFSVVNGIFLKDTFSEVLWRWQAHLEKRFGADSSQAAQNLITISDFLYSTGRYDEANALRDRGLAVLARTAGIESDIYKGAANSAAYQMYRSSLKAQAESQKEFDRLEQAGKEGTLFEAPSDPNQPMDTEEARTLTAEVDKAIADARVSEGTEGLKLLLKKWGDVLVGGKLGEHWSDSDAERTFRTSEGKRLMKAAWPIALDKKAFDHHTFSAIVGRIADAREESSDLPDAIAFIDEALKIVDEAMPGKIEPHVRLLARYAELLDLAPNSKDQRFIEIARSTIERRYGELAALSPTDEDDGTEVVNALMAFGAAFIKREERASALEAYQRAEHLAADERFAGDLERDEIAVALAQLKDGADSLQATADVTFSRIAKKKDTDPEKVADLESAAMHYHDIEFNREQALRFIREAVRLQKVEILDLVASMPLSASEELEARKEYFDNMLRINIDLLVSGGTTQRLEDIREAFDLFQWRRNSLAGNALLRSSARAALSQTERVRARNVEKAVIRWKQVEAMLIAAGLGGEGDLASLSDQQVALQAEFLKASASLAGQSELFRGLSGTGKLDLATVRSLVAPDEALLVFAKGEIRGLYVLALTRDGGALFDLERGADGAVDYNRMPDLKAAFETFQGSFSWPRRDFDYDSANVLYRILFAPLDSYLKDVRRLVIIPDLSFPSLAYPALVAELPKADAPAESVAWLTTRFTLSTALSLDSFVAIRSQPVSSGARTFLGFADPRVDNPACAPVSAFATGTTSTGNAESGLCEIPETLDHVSLLARSFGADPSASIIAGAGLNKAAVIERLRRPARVLAFATHGLMAEQMTRLAGISEPALLLSTPPADGSEADRWLTVRDIEVLTIDADLVLLSACNTSADGGIGGEAFSGLARAFFEAGARSLLVTNWYIDAVETREFLRVFAPILAVPGRIDVALALQQAMLARMIEAPHPRDWAVFTHVGG